MPSRYEWRPSVVFPPRGGGRAAPESYTVVWGNGGSARVVEPSTIRGNTLAGISVDDLYRAGIFNEERPPVKESEEKEKMSRVNTETQGLYRLVPEAFLGQPVRLLSAAKKSFYQKTPAEGYVGLELEQELKKEEQLIFDSNIWKYERDGSLRDFGFELVLRQPLPVSTMDVHIDELFTNLALLRQKLSTSIRTSYHVHFDVAQYKMKDVLSFAVLYWLCEPFLSEFAGETRKGNLFCIRAIDSGSYPSAVERIAQNRSEGWANPLFQEGWRYGSFNFNALAKFGSAEIRLCRGLDNATEAKLWVKALNNIRLAALDFNSPKQVLDFFQKEVTPQELYAIALGDEVYKHLKDYVPSTVSQTEIDYQTRKLAQSFANLRSSKLVWDTTNQLPELVKKYNLSSAAMKKQVENVRARDLEAAVQARDERLLRNGYNYPNLPPEPARDTVVMAEMPTTRLEELLTTDLEGDT